MRRTTAVAVASGLALAGAGVAGSAAVADEHVGGLPEHSHVLVLGAELDLSGEHPVLLDARKCVDLAAGQALPLKAQHQHVHFGNAGEALMVHAGNLVAPTAPFPGVPWTDCESLLAFFGVDID